MRKTCKMSFARPLIIPKRFPPIDPTKGEWVIYSNALVSKVVVQGDNKEEILQQAKLKGCQPPILLMRSDWEYRRDDGLG